MNAVESKGRASKNVAANFFFSFLFLVPHGYPNGSDWNSLGCLRKNNSKKKKYIFFIFIILFILLSFFFLRQRKIHNRTCKTLNILFFPFSSCFSWFSSFILSFLCGANETKQGALWEQHTILLIECYSHCLLVGWRFYDILSVCSFCCFVLCCFVLFLFLFFNLSE